MIMGGYVRDCTTRAKVVLLGPSQETQPFPPRILQVVAGPFAVEFSHSKAFKVLLGRKQSTPSRLQPPATVPAHRRAGKQHSGMCGCLNKHGQARTSIGRHRPSIITLKHAWADRLSKSPRSEQDSGPNSVTPPALKAENLRQDCHLHALLPPLSRMDPRCHGHANLRLSSLCPHPSAHVRQ